LQAARARGRLGGRRKALNKGQRELVVKLYNSREKTVQEIGDLVGVSRQTVYAYVQAASGLSEPHTAAP